MTTTYLSFDVGTKNLGVAVARVPPGGASEMVLLQTVDIRASSTDRVCLKLWDYLDAIVAAHGGGETCKLAALIEQQPSKARSVMRSVELGIRHYFLMLGRSRKGGVVVKSVSPRTKLQEAVHYEPGSTVAQQYRARKKAGVTEMLKRLEGAPLALEALTSGKADDAADAALYIVRHGGATSFVDANTKSRDAHAEEHVCSADCRDSGAAREPGGRADDETDKPAADRRPGDAAGTGAAATGAVRAGSDAGADGT
jgi:hypothetical protein